MKNVAVFFGGTSPEKEVSVITGVLTVNSIDKKKYNPIPIYIDKSGEWYSGEYLIDLDNYKDFDSRKVNNVFVKGGSNFLYLKKGKKIKPIVPISSAINCLHGSCGEDGALSGMLNMCGIPLASPSVLSASITMDKIATKYFLKGINVNALPFFETDKIFGFSEETLGFKYPVIVKPYCGGSSIGINVADDSNSLRGALSYALKFNKKAIIEPCLSDFIEINCACYKRANGELVVSECERPVGRKNILSFSDKYEDGGRVFPADIEKSVSDKIKEITKTVYSKLDFNGIIRIDYMLSGEKIYLNEINSVPGSLAYYLFCKTLKDFSKVLSEVIEESISRFSEEQSLERNYTSGILSVSGGKSSKHL